MIKLIVSLLALWGHLHLWRWVKRELEWKAIMHPWQQASDEDWQQFLDEVLVEHRGAWERLAEL